MSDDLHRATAAAAVLGSDERHGALLQSIADVAREGQPRCLCAR